MMRLRRLLAVSAFLGLAALVSSSSLGQPGKKSGVAGGATLTPQSTPLMQVGQPGDGPSESRFTLLGTNTYRPLQGELYFAMQLQPKLEAAPQRPRDFLIMLSTSAAQGGPSWTAGHQIADGVIENAREFDRVSLWTANEPSFTKDLTKGFRQVKDFGDGKILKNALAKYRSGEFPAGNTDLKTALSRAVATFDSDKDRQRILLFLGDGLSTHNPMSEDDRAALAKQMVDKQVAFFPVPLGLQLNPNTLHGLANSTGGVVLRTQVEAEKLVDALKRYKEAFDAPILYSAKLTLPAEMVEVCPSTLPPLRADSPTLVVGRMKKEVKQIDYTITGKIDGRKGTATLTAKETVHAPSLDNFFLVSLIDQWAKAKHQSAILRADRALALAYEETRLHHQELHENAQLALQDGKYEAAGRLFQQIRVLSPADRQAEAGINVIARLKDGTLDKNKIRKELENRKGKADKLQFVNGKQQWVKVDLALLVAQNDEKLPVPKLPAPGGKQPDGADNMLKEHRERQAVEEQKIRQAVDDAIGQARRTVNADPDGTLDMLRLLQNRVKTNPDLGLAVRDALNTRLETALRDNAADVQRIKLKKQEIIQLSGQTQQNLIREQERRSFEDRADSQFRLFKNLMTVARFEERTKDDLVKAMVQIADEARLKGYNVPVAAKAMYDITMAANSLQTHNTLIRKREAGWLALQMGVEKAHIPYGDEPFIHFPDLVTWKALIRARKDKYDVSTLPDDEQGRVKATTIYRLLEGPVNTGKLQDITLKDALEYFQDMLKSKALDLKYNGTKEPMFVDGVIPIIVDKEAFLAELGADAPDPYTEKVNLPPTPSKMSLQLALRLVLSQVGKGKATYLIRREFIEITTNARYLEDKVIRLYPVGDLAMPIGNSQLAMMGGGFGGGGFPGGMGGMPGMMGGGMMGGMPGMMMGGMGGMPGMMMGGMGGMPGMMMGGGGGTQMTGGSFQASFNGSLGALGATQATGLIDIITRIVDPGNWNKPPQLNPFMMMGGFPGPGMIGMVGMVGMVGMAGGMIGAGAPPDPLLNVDPQTSNSIDFFPPALALIVRAPSRVHTSITGGIIGGRAKRLEATSLFDIERNGLAKFQKDNPKIVVLADKLKVRQDELAKREERIDPTKVWNEAFDKGGVKAGVVIATTDFLFEAGEYKHAAELLKANLRHGVVVRPWVFEALAVALESSGGTPEEIQRVRLSGIALDPQDSQGFLSAAKAVADRGQYDRALAFCKQAALLDPSDYHPYEAAISYAEASKDSQAMEWAVGKLVAQDWPVDNLNIQKNAKQRLGTLVGVLKTEKRFDEAKSLEAALARLNQRDVRIKLIWDNAGGPCELELNVKEPAGSICSLEQKQSPGGGTMLGFNLLDKQPNAEYVASHAFAGDYEVTINRVYGQPLNNRARLEVVLNAGTPQQSRRLEIVRLDQPTTFKLNLKEGRRTELATVSQAANQRQETVLDVDLNGFRELRAVANPSFFGAVATARGGAGTPGQMPKVAAMAARDTKTKSPAVPVMQGALKPGGGVPMTAQVQMNPDQRNFDLVIRPFFNNANAAKSRSGVNLSVVPGGN